MIKRLLRLKLAKLNKSLILLGPRQTGKSTLLKSLNPDLIINLANEFEFIRFSSDAELIFSVINNKKLILIDEVQRIPSLLNSLQVIIDDSKNKKPIHFLLSGSSARKLKRGQANLLPGRVFSYKMGGLCAQELEYKIDIKKALIVGFLPEPYLEKDINFSKKLLETYSMFYLKEEIQAEALTRNLSGFMRFLNSMAEISGQIVDFSKLSTKAKVSRSSSIRFMEILEDTLIGYKIPVFDKAENADIIKHPKFYFFDVGVLNGLLNNFTASADRVGFLFEHLVLSQLKNSAFALDLPIEVFYFRTRNGVEVDFVIKLKNKYFAIEVKHGNVSKHDIQSLKIFKTYFSEVKKLYVVSIAEKNRSLDGITICNLNELLMDIGL